MRRPATSTEEEKTPRRCSVLHSVAHPSLAFAHGGHCSRIQKRGWLTSTRRMRSDTPVGASHPTGDRENA
jgi:hypothetical protein